MKTAREISHRILGSDCCYHDVLGWSHGWRCEAVRDAIDARDAEWKQMVADAQADARDWQARAEKAEHTIERFGIGTDAAESWWKPGPMSDSDAAEWARLNCGPLESCTPELYEQTIVDVSVAVRNTVNIAAARGFDTGWDKGAQAIEALIAKAVT